MQKQKHKYSFADSLYGEDARVASAPRDGKRDIRKNPAAG
jgi:hypothetical protein